MKFRRILCCRKVSHYVNKWTYTIAQDKREVFFRAKIQKYDLLWKVDFYISNDDVTYRRYLILDADTYSGAVDVAKDGKAFSERMLRQGKLKCYS